MPLSHYHNEAPPFTAIIAEDEAPLAMVLKKALTSLWPELSIVGIYSDGKSAQQRLSSDNIDIAFLDISMPYRTGLEIAEYCAAQKIETLIVLITAYPDHALDAFKYNVCDYLLKPLSKERLAETLTRLKKRLDKHEITLKKTSARHIAVQRGRMTHLLGFDEICYLISDQKYVNIVTKESRYLTNKTLNELENELDPNTFWRIHRSSIVNINHIQHCKKTMTGRLALTVNGCDETLTVSRAHLHRFKSV